MAHSNALMATSSLDRISDSRDASGNIATVWQPYSNFRVQTLGGNIIQGQINKIRVAEILFPYNLPTIMSTAIASGLGQPLNGPADNSVLDLQFIEMVNEPAGAPPTINDAKYETVNIPSGYYTGAELAAVIQTGVDASIAAVGAPAGSFTVSFDGTTGSLVLRNNTTWDATVGNSNWFLEVGGTGTATRLNEPSALWTMGLRELYAHYPPIYMYPINDTPSPGSKQYPLLSPTGYPNVAPYPIIPATYRPSIIVCSPYTGCYTQYIDVCSPSLCQAQYVRDGNTNQKVIRRDIIARVYIASDNSVPLTNPAGSRPFLIHRQFKNAKVMKWTAERSIDNIDLVLYDQFGNQLPLVPPTLASAENPGDISSTAILQGQPADFAITFLVDEHDETLSPNLGYTA